MHTITRCRWVAALAASIALLMTSPIGAVAQTIKGIAAESTLDKFLAPASADLATKLEVLQHAVYLHATRPLVVAFRQEYGDRIRTREASRPASDKTLAPGYIFTPLKLDKGAPLAMHHHGSSGLSRTPRSKALPDERSGDQSGIHGHIPRVPGESGLWR
jgi:hypothetical protein